MPGVVGRLILSRTDKECTLRVSVLLVCTELRSVICRKHTLIDLLKYNCIIIQCIPQREVSHLDLYDYLII